MLQSDSQIPAATDNVEITPYHAKYYSYELTLRSPSDSIQKFATTLLDAQVDLNPHQVEAALFAFRSPLSNGAILADEVGLGKTIEAGLLVSQKWAERKRRILIIVPSNLRKQWNQELLEKFFLPSLIMETASFNEEIKKGNFNPFDKESIFITSYHFARNKEIYIQRSSWDLVIIDEAHRLRNVYKPTNKIANSIKNALAEKPKVMLTATPLQNSLLELYGLVSIIDDFAFGDLKSFKNQYSRVAIDGHYDELKERLRPICQRTLRRQVQEYVRFTNRVAIVQQFYPTSEEQQLYEMVSSYLQTPVLYALPPSQRQLMTLILRKLLASSTFAISDTLEALHVKLEGMFKEDESARIELELENNLSLDFETFSETKEEWIDFEDDESLSDSISEKRIYSEDEKKEIMNEISRLKDFTRLAKSIVKNSKGEALLLAIKSGFTALEEKGAAKKAIIFTESVRTQKYLFGLLGRAGYKGELVLFNGTNSDPLSNKIYKSWYDQHRGTDKVTGSKSADKRAAIVDFFKHHATIMIATEAAAEGINLQFCSLVINYDLPWNPQRIEQRIGRCHRYGQKHDVVVVNFLNQANAADQRVYQLLDEKFKLFNGVFGVSDEVLGSIESGVDFEKRIASIYQDCRTEVEIQTAFDDLQKQLEESIEDRMKITRKSLLENFDEEVHEKLRLNYNSSKEYLDRYTNLLWRIACYALKGFAEFSDKDYSFFLKTNPIPKGHIHPGPYRIGKNIEDANVFRVGHPLAQHILNECRNTELPVSGIIFDYTGSLKKISILERFVGNSGWLSVSLFSITSLETEDHLILSGITDDGETLDNDECHRVFSLNGQVVDDPDVPPLPDKVRKILIDLTEKQSGQLLLSNADRNSGFFDEELVKLEKWADDKKASLEIELKQLDVEIKTLKAEARKLPKLVDKVKAQRHIKEMEKRRNEMRMNLFHHQDEVDQRKENLISTIEARLKQMTSRKELFTIRWFLK